MSNNFRILITDYVWPSIEPERQVLSDIRAEIVVAETGDEEELLTVASNVDGILTCWKPVRESVIANATKCRIIARYGIGLDNIDVDAATANGIIVTNVPTYCVDEVSDHAIALLLSCARNITRYSEAVRSGTWNQNSASNMYRLRGKTIGIVGFGSIAKTIIPKVIALGLNVQVYSPRTSDDAIKQIKAKKVSFGDLIRSSDFVSIHAPLTSETHHMFGHEEFRAMKPTAILINTARGGIVDTLALTKALESGEIAGAGLDVLETEPIDENDPLLKMDNVVITPHAAFISEESILELEVTAATSVKQVLSDELPESVVNPSVLERPNLRAKSLMTK